MAKLILTQSILFSTMRKLNVGMSLLIFDLCKAINIHNLIRFWPHGKILKFR